MSDNPIIPFPQPRRHPQEPSKAPSQGRPKSKLHQRSEALLRANRSTPEKNQPLADDRDPAPDAAAPTASLLLNGPLSAVLGAAGHSRACITRIRSGRSLTCSCGRASEPLDDAARAVGLAIRFARMSATRQVAMPHGIIAALVEQVDAGNAAAILVWQWLARRGQIPATCDLRPKLRLVCERG